MKSVLMTLVATTVLSTLTSLAQAQSIAFEPAPDAASPLEITIIQREEVRASIYRLHDRNGVRFVIAARPVQGGENIPNVRIYNSSQSLIGDQDLTVEEKEHLALVTSRASTRCPVVIEVNRETRKIERVKPTCDELAELPSDSQNG